MNCLLILPDELFSSSYAVITGARAVQVQRNHALKEGISITIAVLDQGLGSGQVLLVSPERIELSISIGRPPPARCSVHLMCAVSRPQTIKKILHLASSTGILSLSFHVSDKTVPGYAQSKSLEPANMRRELLLGLEQSIDCVLPEVRVFGSLSAALENRELRKKGHSYWFCHTAELEGASGRLIATHKYSQITFALGPEGGWSEHEVETLQAAGFSTLWLGPRQYRVEIAAALLVGMVFGASQ